MVSVMRRVVFSALAASILLAATASGASAAQIAGETNNFNQPDQPIVSPDEREFAAPTPETVVASLEEFRSAVQRGETAVVDPLTGLPRLVPTGREFSVNLGVPTLRAAAFGPTPAQARQMRPADAFDWIDRMGPKTTAKFRMRSLTATTHRNRQVNYPAYDPFAQRKEDFRQRSNFNNLVPTQPKRHGVRHDADPDQAYYDTELTGVAGSLQDVLQFVGDGMRYALSLLGRDADPMDRGRLISASARTD